MLGGGEDEFGGDYPSSNGRQLDLVDERAFRLPATEVGRRRGHGRNERLHQR